MSSKKPKLRCVACRKLIEGRPRVMRLHITSEDAKLIANAKKLGFTSASWRTGDSMEGVFHARCFKLAAFVWEVAFETRPLSPRR